MAPQVVAGMYPGVTTTELDNLAAETAAYLSTKHPDYSMLAARISVSNLQKNTKKSFAETVKELYEYVYPLSPAARHTPIIGDLGPSLSPSPICPGFRYVDKKTGRNASLISEATYKVVMDHAAELDAAIIYDRDFNFDYFGFRTLERAYLLKIHGRTVERPQHMLVRPSCLILSLHLDGPCARNHRWAYADASRSRHSRCRHPGCARDVRSLCDCVACTIAERRALIFGHQIQPDVGEVVHPRFAHTVQCGHPT